MRCQIVCYIASNFRCLFIIFWIATPVCYTVNSCAYFDFKNSAAEGKKVIAKEYTNVFIKFKLINTGCKSGASSSFLEIGSLIPGSNDLHPQCRIIEKNGGCSESEFHNAQCSCTPEPGVYTFSKNVSRTDNAEWKWDWWASKDKSNETLIRFEISYPARITELSFDGKETLEPLNVQRNKSILVKCSWKSGNPPTSVSLLHGNTVLAKSNSFQSGYLTYTLKLSNCNDSGIIDCAADISDYNKTATLLVECPPEFASTSKVVHNLKSSWQTFELRFPVHTHTLDLTQCTLAKQNGKNYQCVVDNISYRSINANNTKCQCIMTGVPPNLILTLHVNDQNIEAGPWLLNISNAIGSGLTNFSLFRDEAQDESDGTGPGNSPADVKTVIIAILGIVIIFVVSGVLVKQRWPLVMRSCSSGRHGSPDKETKPEAAHSEKTQNSIDHEHSTPQTTTDVATVNPNIVHAQINQDGKEGEQGVRLFCQGAGVTQVVIYLKDQQTNPDTLLPNTMAIAGPADYLTPCAPQYATLDRAPQNTRNNSQVLHPNICPRCDDHQKQNPPHYCSFPLSNECDNRLDSVHPVNDKLSDLALNHENLNKLAANNFSVDNSIHKIHSDDYMYSSID